MEVGSIVVLRPNFRTRLRMKVHRLMKADEAETYHDTCVYGDWFVARLSPALINMSLVGEDPLFVLDCIEPSWIVVFHAEQGLFLLGSFEVMEASMSQSSDEVTP